MGTVFSFDVRDHPDRLSARQAIALAVAELHRIDARYSTYLAPSEISRHRAGALTEAELSDEAQKIFAACRRLRETTRHSFDPWCLPGGVDPSGYVKGWAIGRAAELIGAAGCRNFSVGGGGDLHVRGEPSPGQVWRVGIRHPDDPKQLAAIVAATELSVATSASYERGAHIHDPRTGLPILQHTIRSATVVGPDPGSVDAFATALFVAGLPGFEWLPIEQGYHGMLITEDDRISCDRGFPLLPADA